MSHPKKQPSNCRDPSRLILSSFWACLKIGGSGGGGSVCRFTNPKQGTHEKISVWPLECVRMKPSIGDI